MNRCDIKTAKWKVYCASASGFRRDFDGQLNEHVIMVIQLSRLTVDSSTYTEYVLVSIAKFRLFKRA